MPKVLKITINTKCETNPLKPEMSSETEYTDVQWHCASGQSFTLALPGGVFEGKQDDFLLPVNGPVFVPDSPLKRIANIKHTIVTYVYDSSGVKCSKDRVDPPEIIIAP